MSSDETGGLASIRFTILASLLASWIATSGCTFAVRTTGFGPSSSPAAPAVAQTVAPAAAPASVPPAAAPRNQPSAAKPPPPKAPTRAQALASFEDVLRPAVGGTAALDVAGFRLGMTPEQALAACDAHGKNHTSIFSLVDASGAVQATMPIPDPVPAGPALLRRFFRLKTGVMAGPYQSTLYCTWEAGVAELSFSPPPSNVVSSVRFTSRDVPVSAADYARRLIARYGTPREQLGPENTQRLRADGLVATSLKWLGPEAGLDCAPPVKNRTAASSESVFTPLIPFRHPAPATCKTHLIVRIAGRPEPIGEFTLMNYSTAIDEDERFWSELRRAHPSLPTRAPARSTSTESPELACKALEYLGCRQQSRRECEAELQFLNRTRHVIPGASGTSEQTLYQCLINSSTVEQATACGVTCNATPQAHHASVGSNAFPTELFTAACERMNQLQCGGTDLGQCDLALQSRNNGYLNAECIESAKSQADVLYCGASCGGAAALATLLTESFHSACIQLARVGCSVGASKTCDNDLRRILPVLRQARPNPHECLAKAENLYEVAKCGLPCPPP